MRHFDESIYSKLITKTTIALIWTWFIIFFVGWLANVFTFLIFSRKRFRNTIFSTYFRSLVLVDSFSLLTLFISFMNNFYDIDLLNLSPFLCVTISYFSYSVPAISSHIMVAISADRYVSIGFSNRFLLRKKSGFQVGILGALTVFNLAFYSENALITFDEFFQLNNATNETIVNIPNNIQF